MVHSLINVVTLYVGNMNITMIVLLHTCQLTKQLKNLFKFQTKTSYKQVICFILSFGWFPEFYMLTFQNTLSVPSS